MNRSLTHPRDPAFLLDARRRFFGQWRLLVNAAPVEAGDGEEVTLRLSDGSESRIRVGSRLFDPYPVYEIDGDKYPTGHALGVMGVFLVILPSTACIVGMPGLLIGGPFSALTLWLARARGDGFGRFALAAAGTVISWVGTTVILLASLFAGPTHPPAAPSAAAQLRPTPTQQAAPVGQAPAAPLSALEVLELRRHVKEGRFAVAESLLKQLGREARADVRAEGRWFRAYRGVFVAPDPRLRAGVEAWVAASPNGPEALTARAWLGFAQAFANRGEGPGALVTMDQSNAFEASLATGAADALRAIAVDPDQLPAYWMLQNTARAEGDQASAMVFLDRALERSPGSFVSYQQAMIAMYPRWGGSFERMRGLAELAELSSDLNPDLLLLRAYPDYEAGRIGSHDAAGRGIPLLRRALRAGDDPLFYASLGHALWHTDQNAAAVAALDTALALDPTSANAWGDRARARRDLAQQDPGSANEHRDAATNDARMAQALTPSERVDLRAVGVKSSN